jgi:hypothetical protein
VLLPQRLQEARFPDTPLALSTLVKAVEKSRASVCSRRKALLRLTRQSMPVLRPTRMHGQTTPSAKNCMQLMLMWSGGPLGQESGKNCLLWLLRLGHAQHAASFRHLWCVDFLQGRLNADDEQKEKKTNLCFPFFITSYDLEMNINCPASFLDGIRTQQLSHHHQE